jgi:two-component system, chemotaxis family, response regulator WspF
MRIALVNDVRMALEALRSVVLRTGQHQVAWMARDGAEAVELCARDRPDLILMDLIMPGVDGVQATHRIMARTPCAIVIVTATVNGHSSKVFEAMGAGALDAVKTPVLESAGTRDGAQALLAKLETIHRLLGGGRVNTHLAAPRQSQRPVAPHHDQLVALGASAGGPAALGKILATLPPDFPAPLVVVQHVDVQFAQGLANWLDSQTSLPVRVARQGDRPEPGTVLLAGREGHLVFASPTRLAYVRAPAESVYRPSIDVFFESAARYWRGKVLAALLTGMGRDGAEGLRHLRLKGHHTIAQDRYSSAVYGMPKAAAQLRAAGEVLPLDKIGPRLSTLIPPHTHKHA